MSAYTLLLYLVYINDTVAAVNSLVLYAFLGMAIVTVLFRRKITFNKYWIWYLGFIVLAMISTFYAPNSTKAIYSLYNLVVAFGLTFAMSIVMTDRKRMELFMRCLVIGCVVLTIYLFATGQMEVDTDTSDRLGNELTGNANTFASLYMAAACSSVYFIMSKRNIIFKLFYVVAFASQEYALALSGGRKFFIIPFLVLFLMLLQKKDKRGKRHVIIYTLIGIAGAVALFYALINIPVLYETVGHRFESLFEYTVGSSQSSDGSTIEREHMRARAMELWAQSPLFGRGHNAFAEIGGWGVYSHCNYTELLCNYGIVGLVYYYGFGAYSACRLLVIKSNHPMRRFLIAILVSFLLFDFGAVSFSMPLTLTFILMASLVGEMPERFLDIQEEQNGKA